MTSTFATYLPLSPVTTVCPSRKESRWIDGKRSTGPSNNDAEAGRDGMQQKMARVRKAAERWAVFRWEGILVVAIIG